MKKLLALLLLVSAIFTAGCDQKEIFNKLIPKEETEFTKTQMELFLKKDFASLYQHMHPTLKNQKGLQAELDKLVLFFPNENPKSVQVVGVYLNTKTTDATETKEAKITLQYEFSSKWVLASVSTVQEKDSPPQIVGIFIQPIQASLEELNKFTFAGKSIAHYLMFLVVLAVPLLILYSLITCVRTPIAKRKWLWIIFILFGVCSVGLNWSTGETSIQLLNFQLLGSGFYKGGPYAPLSLTTSIPLGAIIFLFMRRKLVTKAVSPQA